MNDIIHGNWIVRRVIYPVMNEQSPIVLADTDEYDYDYLTHIKTEARIEIIWNSVAWPSHIEMKDAIYRSMSYWGKIPSIIIARFPTEFMKIPVR